MWRISRIRAIEGGIFANGHRANVDAVDAGHPEVDTALAAADTFAQQAHQIILLSLYETRLTRILEKNRAELKALQSSRNEVREKAFRQAAILTEHAESRGETYEPGDDFLPAANYGGFVFSADEITRRRYREYRYDAAWRYHSGRPCKNPEPDSGPQVHQKAA
jgi:hypothetical protein